MSACVWYVCRKEREELHAFLLSSLSLRIRFCCPSTTVIAIFSVDLLYSLTSGSGLCSFVFSQGLCVEKLMKPFSFFSIWNCSRSWSFLQTHTLPLTASFKGIMIYLQLRLAILEIRCPKWARKCLRRRKKTKKKDIYCICVDLIRQNSKVLRFCSYFICQTFKWISKTTGLKAPLNPKRYWQAFLSLSKSYWNQLPVNCDQLWRGSVSKKSYDGSNARPNCNIWISFTGFGLKNGVVCRQILEKKRAMIFSFCMCKAHSVCVSY